MKKLQWLKNKWIWFSSSLVIVLVGLTVARLMVLPGRYTNALIAQEVAQLRTIFARIDMSCGIIGFDHKKNNIDFLNVVKFVSSEVGSMNLKHPQGWQGPYVQDNPTMQKQFYQIVHTRDGYYIAPGDGVKLGNGKVIGKDIILNQDTDFPALLAQEGMLLMRDKQLAVKLELGKKADMAEIKTPPVRIPPEIAVQVKTPRV